MRLEPRERIFQLWRTVVRYSFRDGMFVWGAPHDALTDAQQLLCILHPATQWGELKLDVPAETTREVLAALDTLGDERDIPRRLLRSLNEYMGRHADAGGAPLFSVDARRYEPATSAGAQLVESVESYAAAIRLTLAAIGFCRVFRQSLNRPELAAEANLLEERASLRLTAAMVGLLRSFTTRVAAYDTPEGVELRRTIGQDSRAEPVVLEEFRSGLRLVRAGLYDATIGTQSPPDLDAPARFFECGFAWAVVSGAPEIEVAGDQPRQPQGSADRVSHLPSTLLAVHAIDELFSERTRILALLNEEQARLARALQLRYELITAYWSFLGTFGDHRWPLERVPWRTPTGHESDYHSLCVAGITAVELGQRRGSTDVSFSYLVRVYAELARRAGIVRPPRTGPAPQRPSRSGFPVPVASAPDGPYPATTHRGADLVPVLFNGLIRAARATDNNQLRQDLEDLADLTWEHLTNQLDDPRLGSLDDLQAFSDNHQPNWSDVLLIADAMTVAIVLADGNARRSQARLGFVHQLLADADEMFTDASKSTDDLSHVQTRLDRARRLIDQQPSRAAAMLYQVITSLETVLETGSPVAPETSTRT